MVTIILSLLAGVGIGSIIGQEYVLYKQKKGFYLPVNPYAVPVMEKDKGLVTIMTPQGAKVKKVESSEQGSVTKIKDLREGSEEKKYI